MSANTYLNITEVDFADIKSNLKTYLDYNNIDYKNVIEKSELLNLLPKKEIEEEFGKKTDTQDIEEDIQLNIEELRTARLKFFANKTI